MDEIPGRSVATLADGIRTLQRRWPDVVSTSPEAPLFVLAAGWFSGAGVVERLLSRHYFLWSEPYGQAGLIDRLAAPLKCLTDSWPDARSLWPGQHNRLPERPFQAVPHPQQLLLAHQQFYDALLAQPARAAGAEGWGLREVRLTADHALYFQWLYPRAKFLFVHRNPYDAYREYAAARQRGGTWFHRWPDRPLTVREFGSHWRKATASFLSGGGEVNSLVVSYDDLMRGELTQIESFLGVEISKQNLPAPESAKLAEISERERIELDAEVSGVAVELGYQTSTSRATRPNQVKPAADQADNRRCVVLVPVGGHIEPVCQQALEELERRGYPVRRVRGYAAIDQGRNQMASDALAAGFEETLWIDADIGFQPDDVDRMRAHGLPIVCGIYPKKSRRELACHALPGTEKLVFGAEGGLAEILYAGTGFLLVRRHVYDAIQQQLRLPACNEQWGRATIPFFQPLIKPHGTGYWYLAEDYAFCERARQCGFSILADTQVRLEHIGSYAYTWEDAGTPRQRFGTFHFHLSGAASGGGGAESAAVASDPAVAQLARRHPWPPQRPPGLANRQPEALEPAWRQVLSECLAAQPALILQLGAGLGLATRFLATGAPRATIITVQPEPEPAGNSPAGNGPAGNGQAADACYELFLSNCWEFRQRVIPLRMPPLAAVRELAELGLRPRMILVESNTDGEFASVQAAMDEALNWFPEAQLVGDDWSRSELQRAVMTLAYRRGQSIETRGQAWRLLPLGG